MSLRKQYKVNAQRQEQGAPVHLPPNEDGSVPCIWVRRVTSADGAYQTVMERVMAPHRRAQELGALPPKKFDELLLEVFADGALAKWENVLLADVFDDDALEGFAEDTLGNKLRLLTLLPELHADLRTFAYQRANYLESCIEADAKNS